MIWERALCNFLLIILNHILQRFLHTPLPLASTSPPPSLRRLLISSVWRLTVTNRGTPQQYLHTTGGTNYYRLFSSTFFFFPEALVIHVRLQSSWGLSFQDALCHFVNNALCSLCHISDWINMKIIFFFLSAAYFLTWLTILLSLHSVLKEKHGVNSLKWDSNIQIPPISF